MNERILDAPRCAELLRDYARLRSRVRDVLHYGRLEAPLARVRQDRRIELSLDPAFCMTTRAVRIDRDAIVHSVWRGPDG